MYLDTRGLNTPEKETLEYENFAASIVSISEKQGAPSAEEFGTKHGSVIIKRLLTDVNKLDSLMNNGVDNFILQSKRDYKNTMLKTGIILMAGLIVTIILSIVVVKLINKSLLSAVDYINILATGDFSKNIPEDYLKGKDVGRYQDLIARLGLRR